MLHPDRPLAADRPHVLDETFDGEAVLVHLTTGCYYALNPSASLLWTLVRDGATPATARDAIARLHGAAAGAHVEPLLEQLVAERLLVEAPDGSTAGATPDVPALAAFAEPKVERFEDMQQLLLVDPIHDIALDGDGFPAARPPERAA